ncbi:MAG: hypothetical protein ACRDOK_17850 [Streptosporangiaceae bacterium]
MITPPAATGDGPVWLLEHGVDASAVALQLWPFSEVYWAVVVPV